MFNVEKNETVSSLIVKQVIKKIDCGELKEGDTLPIERELAELFGASRNTVREALRVLETYGVVRTSVRKPPMIVRDNLKASVAIASIRFGQSEKQFHEMRKLRQVVELSLVDNIFEHITDDDIVTLKYINNELKAASCNTISSQLDFDFHNKLVSISQNSISCVIYLSLSEQIKNIMQIGNNINESNEEAYLGHERVIQSLIDRDRDLFRRYLSDHFEYSQEMLKQTIVA
ncbi:GntR family transcriptional regulator [Photobacterium sp. ZSDE20]|uniref:GntR family transcriptional regulator n=1 Tax=Photobacterium pectinilyticum TaxID=2906793 RepID=A0ABT1N2D3_9GAMM|nr:GntR family transcriptional regulator [Photobacterium sp. ZSDE20]MCQ1058883.1 GntR family transcriptional regulator [Photobacterium sp. ZSDE20]MDD1823827.1 GntR family transcriptional regulator [Photobacterium sp. ZSDE20]